ncbi:MAG TPA: asparagine synthase-related protein [Candidatus Acidoferrum sp.]
MSGFVCIVHGDKAPIDRALLQLLTDFLSFRGPDGREVFLDGAVGLGHALLRTTRESKNERQPASLEGRCRIVADARLDAREELIADLQRAERNACSNMPDCELILNAYAVWGMSCVDHLRGDFSFALWDASCGQLFCARDHFGVKPFFYASNGSRLIISNTLNCIRRHPSVSGRLNELAIGDFLLFDTIRELGATSFADVQRLPPAHVLVHKEGGTSIRRYWTLPVSDALRHGRQSDCIDQFRELLDRAVADRMRADSVGVLMSGGLDSSTVAASAQRALNHNGPTGALRAYTEVFESLIPHEERRYAELVAEALRIPIEFQASDETGLWKHQNQPNHQWPEPVHFPWSDGGLAQLRQVAVRNRVALTGFGGDPAFSCLLSVHFLQLFKKRKLGCALTDALRYLTAEGRLSRLYLGTRWRRRFAPKSAAPQYPEWLNLDIEKRLGLRERWESLNRPAAPNGAVRPVAYEAMMDPLWAALFEGYDSGATGIPVEIRHPFFDLRVVNFLLALPALPWCSDKELLREAARGILPEAVRLRGKSALLADPLIALLQQTDSAWVDSFVPVPELGRYVDRRRIPKVAGEKNPWTAWVHLRPLSLNFWLRSEVALGINLRGAA